jgi:hypothetical protein
LFRYKDEENVFDLVFPMMEDPKKQSLSEVFFRLIDIGCISKNHTRPEGLAEAMSKDLDDIFDDEEEAPAPHDESDEEEDWSSKQKNTEEEQEETPVTNSEEAPVKRKHRKGMRVTVLRLYWRVCRK